MILVRGISPCILKVCCPNSKDLQAKITIQMASEVAPEVGIPRLKNSSCYYILAWAYFVVRLRNGVLQLQVFKI
jgi:hypothetical protein